jgi:hypothetical protein
VPWADKSAQQVAQQANRNERVAARQQLEPGAFMKVQFDGGSLKNLTCAQSSYLNAKVMAEANRDRNGQRVILG